MRIALAAIVATCLNAAAVSAADAPSLDQAFSGLSQAVKPQAAALKQSVKANNQRATLPAQRVKSFNLDYERGAWHLRPNPNPPGERLTIDVDQGDHVRLELTNMEFRGGTAQFLIDGIEAMVDGRPSHGIDVWLSSTGQTAVVEFEAAKPGIHPINRSFSIGRLVIRSRR